MATSLDVLKHALEYFSKGDPRGTQWWHVAESCIAEAIAKEEAEQAAKRPSLSEIEAALLRSAGASIGPVHDHYLAAAEIVKLVREAGRCPCIGPAHLAIKESSVEQRARIE